VRCYGEHVEKHKENLRNLIGTYWELKRNIVEHIGNEGNMKKKILPPNKLKTQKSKAH
jgi:hypothetical protein